jgi:hypothetical protein
MAPHGLRGAFMRFGDSSRSRLGIQWLDFKERTEPRASARVTAGRLSAPCQMVVSPGLLRPGTLHAFAAEGAFEEVAPAAPFNAFRRFAPSGEPSPVAASQPGPAEKDPLDPLVMSFNPFVDAGRPYKVG